MTWTFDTAANASAPRRGAELPRVLLRPLPLGPLQPILARIVRRVARKRPELFRRLGPHCARRFAIDPTNMPFVLLLQPDPKRPRLSAVRRGRTGACDAQIAGSFLTLLDLVDGRLDGDALFFSRTLRVTGDTEAVVSLRNALDDLEGSVADDTAELFGPPGRAALARLRRLRGGHAVPEPGGGWHDDT
jgi:predicted lipid carrier protein YhbT